MKGGHMRYRRRSYGRRRVGFSRRRRAPLRRRIGFRM